MNKYFKLFEQRNDIIYTSAFKNWFGDWESDPENSSKVVDSDGKPLVVYHTTTNSNFDTFRPSYEKNIDGKWKQIYKGVDVSYEEWENIDWEELGISPYDEYWFATKPWGDGNILPFYLNIRNMVIGDEGDEGGQGAYYDYVRTGQDGLMIPNGQNTGSDFYVCVDAKQIKIADGQNITFSTSEENFKK